MPESQPKKEAFVIRSWLESARLDRAAPLAKSGSALTGYVYLFGSEDQKSREKIASEHLLPWQKESFKKNHRELVYLGGKKGPVWIVRGREKSARQSHLGLLDESPYAHFRDLVGGLVAHFKAHQLSQVQVIFFGTSAEQELGAMTGLEVGAYSFRESFEGKSTTGLPALFLQKNRGQLDASLREQAVARGRAVNFARHLVNLPPNELHPVSFAELLGSQKKKKGFSIQVWDEKRLAREKMGLHLAVGAGASQPPRLVHLRWRPHGAKRKPVALVGKGLTFDSGGLDIKPSSGMRLMKKDMGGAAAVAAVFFWAVEMNHPQPLDAYLALAENAVDANSFRPSDVLVARSGAKVEIDNTDAEGRLVLADALDVALTQKGQDEPECVIDVATLTGAIKVALGADVAGLFSNDDRLAESLQRAGQEAGDFNWRMPLVEKYAAGLSSNFSDFKNSTEGFGGAITAALFLQKFVRGFSWAHLDIYAWSDKGQGPVSSGGGSGQGVQALIEWLEERA